MTIIYVGSDHAGFYLKEYLKKNMPSIKFIDVGCENDNSCDYPDYAHKVAKEINNSSGEHEQYGLLRCGTGQGMNMTAIKYPEIRSALCYNKYIADQSRRHNNANVITIGSRTKDQGDWHEFIEIIQTFIHTKFEGGRHSARIDKITCP